MGVGPSAESVQSAGVAVPAAAVASTTLTKVSLAGTAVLVMVHVACSPSARVTDALVVAEPPVHTQPDAEYPSGPVSDSV